MLPAVIALFFSSPEQTSSTSGLPVTFNPYPTLAPTGLSNTAARVASSPSSYSTPSYNEWRNAIIHAGGPSATFKTKTDRDCQYDVEYGDLVKRATSPRDLAAMLRDEYLPAPEPTVAGDVIERDVDGPYAGYPPLTPSTYKTTSTGKGVTATLRTTYFVPIPTHETWSWKVKPRKTPALHDRGLVSSLSQMGSSVSSGMSDIIDKRTPSGTLSLNSLPAGHTRRAEPVVTLSTGHMVLDLTEVTLSMESTHTAASTSRKTSTEASVSHSTASSAWTTVTAPPDTYLTWTTVTAPSETHLAHTADSKLSQPTHDSESSRPARLSFTTSFSIAPHQLMTIVYEEEVVTRQTTGGGVTKTLTETLIHYPAMAPVPPMIWTIPGTTRSRSTTSTETVVAAPTTKSKEIAQASIVMITSKTTASASTTTITRASAIATVSSSVVNSPATKNRPPFPLAMATLRALGSYLLVVTGLWLVSGIIRPALAVIITTLLLMMSKIVIKPVATQVSVS